MTRKFSKWKNERIMLLEPNFMTEDRMKNEEKLKKTYVVIKSRSSGEITLYGPLGIRQRVLKGI